MHYAVWRDNIDLIIAVEQKIICSKIEYNIIVKYSILIRAVDACFYPMF